MGGVFVVFLSLLQVYLCWQAYRVLGKLYTSTLFVSVHIQVPYLLCCVAALLW